jgi:hypothetical protein
VVGVVVSNSLVAEAHSLAAVCLQEWEVDHEEAVSSFKAVDIPSRKDNVSKGRHRFPRMMESVSPPLFLLRDGGKLSPCTAETVELY